MPYTHLDVETRYGIVPALVSRQKVITISDKVVEFDPSGVHFVDPVEGNADRPLVYPELANLRGLIPLYRTITRDKFQRQERATHSCQRT